MIILKKNIGFCNLLLIALIIIICSKITIASAQQQPSTQTEKEKPDTIARPKLKTVKLSDLSKETYRNKELISDIGSTLFSDEELLKIEKNIDSLLLNVDAFIEANSIDTADTYFFMLESNRRKWNRVKSRLEEGQIKLSKILDDLYSKSGKLNNISMTWSLTKEAQKDTAILSLITKRTNELLSDVNELNTKLISLIEFVLSQSDKVAIRQVIVENYIKSVDKLISSSRKTLLKRNSPLLFKAFFIKSSEDRLSVQIKSVADGFMQDFKGFGHVYETEIFISIIIYLIILFLFYSVSIKLSSKDYCKEMGFTPTTINVLRKPLSVSLLLFFFISFLVFSYANPVFQGIITILALIPSAILTSQVITGRMKKYVYLLLLTYIPIIFAMMLPQNVLPSRLLSLAISLYSIIIFLPLVRHGSWSDVIGSLIVRKWILRVVSLFLGIQILSMLLNIVGFVRIAGALSSSTIKIIVNLLFYYLLIVILRALIVMFIKSKFISSLPVFKKNLKVIVTKAERFVGFAGVLIWIYSVLLILNIKDIVYEGILKFNNTIVRIGELQFTPGDFITFFFILWVSIVITNTVKGILEDGILPRLKLKRGVPATISILVKYALITTGFMIAVSAVGINLDKLTILLGAFGVGIGFGLQNIFNNLISGLILLFERPIHKNDVVEVGTFIGQVRNIGFRSSNIRTFDGAEVIVPNGHLISDEVINWTLSDQQKRIEVLAGVAYGSDVDKVIEILFNIVKNHEEVLEDPEPLVLFKEMGESSLDFRLLFWVDNFQEWIRIRSEVVYMIYRDLTAAGITIPFPQRDIHIKENKLKNTKSGK